MSEDEFLTRIFFDDSYNFYQIDNAIFEEVLYSLDKDALIKVMLELNDRIKNSSEKIRIINEVFSTRKIDFAKSLLFELGPEMQEKYSEGLSIILDELMENEEVSFSDIKFIGEGSFSKVYQIGSKVLKVGFPRIKYEVPNHPRIAQPLIRRNLKDKDGVKKGCVEIARLAEKINKNEPGIKKEIYELYRDLRNSGIICTDMRLSNLGRLLEDNSNLYKIKKNGEEPLNVNPSSAGLKGELNGETLRKGELVIIDTDCIFHEDDKGLVFLDDVTILEEIYQNELKGIEPDYNRVILEEDIITPILEEDKWMI